MNGAPITYDTVKFLKEEINKPTEDSKKWKAFVRGIYGVAGMFVVFVIAFLIRPDKVGELVSMANIAIGAYASIVSIFLGAQATVDFRNSASLADVATKIQPPTRKQPVECPKPPTQPVDNPDK